MRNSFLILIIMIALFGGCNRKYDAVAGDTIKQFVSWHNDTITWEGDTRYTITIYTGTKEANGPRWYPIKYTDVTKYNENTGTLVFQTTREVVRFNGIYIIER